MTMIKMKMAASMVAGARPFIDVIAATALLYLAKETPLQTFLDTLPPAREKLLVHGARDSEAVGVRCDDWPGKTAVA